MPRKRTPVKSTQEIMVNFEFQDRTYQIDPRLRKVYRRFVEIETSRAAEIFSTWRSQHAIA